VDELNASQARDHIEMVDRILAETQQRLCTGGEYFVVWGVYEAIVTVLVQLVTNQRLSRSALWADAVFLLAAIAFTVIRGRASSGEAARFPLIQREFLNVLWLTIALGFIADATGFNLFAGWGAAAIWCVVDGIILFYIGIHGNRRAQIAGVVVVASMVIANFLAPAVAGYVMAAGMLLGYAGFGATELLVRD
jgi:hypothetical protein